jgi:hypothetical protein
MRFPAKAQRTPGHAELFEPIRNPLHGGTAPIYRNRRSPELTNFRQCFVAALDADGMFAWGQERTHALQYGVAETLPLDGVSRSSGRSKRP